MAGVPQPGFFTAAFLRTGTGTGPAPAQRQRSRERQNGKDPRVASKGAVKSNVADQGFSCQATSHPSRRPSSLLLFSFSFSISDNYQYTTRARGRSRKAGRAAPQGSRLCRFLLLGPDPHPPSLWPLGRLRREPTTALWPWAFAAWLSPSSRMCVVPTECHQPTTLLRLLLSGASLSRLSPPSFLWPGEDCGASERARLPLFRPFICALTKIHSQEQISAFTLPSAHLPVS